jgi:hypothetical protein
MTTKVWSQSRQEHLELSEMHGQHLLNTYRKILRDEYLDENSNLLQGDARTELITEIEAELEKRGLDPQYATGKVPEEAQEGDPFQ